MKYTEFYHQIQVWKEIIGWSFAALVILFFGGLIVYCVICNKIDNWKKARRRKS